MISRLARVAASIARVRLPSFRAGGYVDQGTADSAVGPIGDYVLGSAVALAASSWGVFRARAEHWRWVRAWLAPARPMPRA